MIARILTAGLLAVALAGIAAAPASAGSTTISQSHCGRSSAGRACQYEYDGKYSKTITYCGSNRRSSYCETVETPKFGTVSIPKAPPQPPPEGQVDPALYGGLPDPNDPAEIRRQRERGAREAAAARR